ncbi:MAG: hypothetical protein ABI824_12025 [Acidobacteriota bacterium]
MKHQLTLSLASSAVFAGLVVSQFAGQHAVAQQKAHPDFSGIWNYSVDLPGTALRQQVDGKAVVNAPDRSGRVAAKEVVRGALPSTAAPAYKPELLSKLKDLDDHQSHTDGVFYCGKPGVPRIGPPRKIMQSTKEIIFFYEDMSGDTYRIIPFNAKHNEDADPSFLGDSVASWDGDKLVVEAVNFVDKTWFGERGYFHSDAMKVTERFWHQGANLAYQVTVEDPKVLTAPWVMAARLIKPSTESLIESALCVEDDAHRLTNTDHHGQR